MAHSAKRSSAAPPSPLFRFSLLTPPERRRAATHSQEDDNEALIQREGDEGLHEVTKVGTKVVATIGPACQSVETLAAMIRAGMSCARIDLSNGDTEYHLRSLRNVAEACRLEKKMIAIMVDTIGPESK